MGQQLGVDVELPDAPGDQLGELAAEIEDDDWAGRGARAVVQASFGRRGVEGGLEVGLDLGVIRREDAVAGVRRFAMDGLAPRRGAR
jgi:hypothetical protein